MSRPRIFINSPAVLAFVFLCFITTLLGVVSNGNLTDKWFMTYHSSLFDIGTYIRMFTHVLGHQGWEHFFNNAALLLILGPLLEEKYGSSNIITVIVLTAIITSIINYLFFWNIALCGASGVVFSFILLASFTSFKKGEIPLTFILVVIIYIGQQVYEGVFVNDNISNMAHIAGGAVGSIFGYIMNKRR